MKTIYCKKNTNSQDNPKENGARLQEILNTLPVDNQEEIEIILEPGIYEAKLEIKVPHLTLRGSGVLSSSTVLTFSDYANDLMEDGSKRGTFRSYSVLVDADYVTLKNLTIENASGDSKTHGQAIALYAEGDHLLVDDCRLLGHQDTLFTGPLPPKELQPGGFIGPKQFAERINGRQHYLNTYICGDVDFIFGSATAFFENCNIESLARYFDDSAAKKETTPKISTLEAAVLKISSPETPTHGYVTAPSTPEGQKYGYVFYKCCFTSKDCPPESVYLSRPWRDYAKAVFISCSMEAHIKKEGFHDWNKPNARENCFYAYSDLIKFIMPDSDPEGSFLAIPDFAEFIPDCDFARELTEEERKEYDFEAVMASR